MAEEKKIKQKSPLVGAQAVPTTLDNTTKLDIDVNKTFVDNILDAGINGTLDTAALEEFTSISNARDQIYQLIDTMIKDSSVASIVRTYAEDVCEVADNGHMVWCESNDPKISKFINYLLNVINVDKNIFGWTYCLIQYGDVYLRLYRESDYSDPLFKQDKVKAAGEATNRTVLNEDLEKEAAKDSELKEAVYLNIHSATDPYSYYVEMVPDPGTMFELTKFGKTYGYIETPNQPTKLDYLNNYLGSNVTNGTYNYKMKSNDVNVYQADDFAHAYLEDNYTRYPEKVEIFMTEDDYKNGQNPQAYTVKRGKSILYDSYKIWREKSLLENAALLNRITRSSLVRTIQVEVGDMPKSQVKNTLRRVKELMEQKSALDTGNSMSEYTNPGPIENNIYLATHGGQGAVTIGQVGGEVDVKNLADLDYWNNKYYSSYGIPKQYFGWTDDGAGFNGGTSLTILSSVYAKSVKRVQNAMLQAITDIINLILLNKGLKSYLNNFVLKMKAPSTQEEKDYREDLTNRISAISNMQSLFADVEDKGRKLEILKNLIATLNYGDDLLSIIDKEIEAADAAKKAEEEQAKIDTEAQGTENEFEEESEAGPAEEESDELDLGMASDAEANEALTPAEAEKILLEDADLTIIDEDLPTPEEINSHKDFSQNE